MNAVQPAHCMCTKKGINRKRREKNMRKWRTESERKRWIFVMCSWSQGEKHLLGRRLFSVHKCIFFRNFRGKKRCNRIEIVNAKMLWCIRFRSGQTKVQSTRLCPKRNDKWINENEITTVTPSSVWILSVAISRVDVNERIKWIHTLVKYYLLHCGDGDVMFDPATTARYANFVINFSTFFLPKGFWTALSHQNLSKTSNNEQSVCRLCH